MRAHIQKYYVCKIADKIYLHFDKIYKSLDAASAPTFPMNKNQLLYKIFFREHDSQKDFIF